MNKQSVLVFILYAFVYITDKKNSVCLDSWKKHFISSFLSLIAWFIDEIAMHKYRFFVINWWFNNPRASGSLLKRYFAIESGHIISIKPEGKSVSTIKYVETLNRKIAGTLLQKFKYHLLLITGLKLAWKVFYQTSRHRKKN